MTMNISSDLKLVKLLVVKNKTRELQWKITFLDLSIHFRREQRQIE